MKKTSLLRATLTLLMLLVLAAPAAAAKRTPAERCDIAKLSAAARLLKGKLRCSSRAARHGIGADVSCDAKAEDVFLDAFGRINGRGGCQQTDDAADVLALIDTLVDELGDLTRPVSDANRCAAAKLNALAKRAFSDLACALKARRGRETEDDCLVRVSGAFGKDVTKAERRGPCLTTDDTESLESALTATMLLLKLAYGGPVAFPTDLAAEVNGTAVDLSWVAGTHANTKILRRLNADPIDAADPDATQVFFGPGQATTDPLTGLLPDTTTVPRTYHYAAFSCDTVNDCDPTASRTTLAATVADVLRAGGYTIYFRHALSDVCTDALGLGTAATTSVPDWWKSCEANCSIATARQLNPTTGASQATTIGQGFDTQGFPVGRVLSSEYCRVRTTAQLMDLGPTIETDQGITFFVYDEANRCTHAYDFLEQTPAASTNTVIVGHAGFATTCTVLGELGMGEGAIFKPDGVGGTTFITRVLPSNWSTLP